MYFKEVHRWAAEADRLLPELRHRRVAPVALVRPEADSAAWQGWKTVQAGELTEAVGAELPCSCEFTFDFGEYCVGHLELEFEFTRPVDAPFCFRAKFAETPFELASDFASYHGTLGRGWLQEQEFVYDDPSGVIRLPRRYAFRYLKFRVEAGSDAYRFRLKNICCDTTTSADWSKLPPPAPSCDGLDREIDRIGMATLAACMQECFEDGPKRDRRLWLGDLRLQALANYPSFGNLDLVKRCLLLFAAATGDEGRVPGCLYLKHPLPVAGNLLYDYQVLYGDMLLDYLRASGDREFVRDLWPVAKRQCELGFEEFEDDRLVEREDRWIFIDWQENLEKECAAHGVMIYALERTFELARELGIEAEVLEYPVVAERLRRMAVELWMDRESGFFRCGPDGQISWASQLWMALAGAVPRDQAADLLLRVIAEPAATGPGGPFLHNQMVLALEQFGRHEAARALTRRYWGKMVEFGADTFWEVFVPSEPLRSPYRDPMINSHCHAWSTPVFNFRQSSGVNIPVSGRR
ncbi:alpha-L-rhamnosidase-related protein [Victivallis vadensis]|uniref:Alpha-L-rhamnosidase-like protein n=1 Tax=Victivallis vadensis TaxID=172901 RepID=A0A2U1AW12_9BACT|nr:family 78 glycoside hydrolase catalytic domain [Victivallis vadensis]PVY40598.1 alpha-L-rhamnosidase-like protein [Victivallis vadensis]